MAITVLRKIYYINMFVVSKKWQYEREMKHWV